MPRTAILAAVGVATCSFALAGCARTAAPAAQPSPAAVQHTPGMIMPDGSTMGASATQSPGPSPAALMVCGADTRNHIAEALRLPASPVGAASWTGSTYTCRYSLPMGPLVLSVTEAKDEAGTTRAFTDLKSTLGTTHELVGLTTGAYGTGDGVVVLRKDTDVLKVDATGLPAQFGPEQSHRDEFAYEVASDVLGCWTGNE